MQPDDVIYEERRKVLRAAALMFGVSLFTGFYHGAGLLKKVDVDAHIMAGTHVSALLSTSILGVYAWSLPFLRYGSGGRKWLTIAVMIFSFGNVAGNFLRAHLRVDALTPTGGAANVFMFTLLQFLSAIPSTAAAIGWWWGLRKDERS